MVVGIKVFTFIENYGRLYILLYWKNMEICPGDFPEFTNYGISEEFPVIVIYVIAFHGKFRRKNMVKM